LGGAAARRAKGLSAAAARRAKGLSAAAARRAKGLSAVGAAGLVGLAGVTGGIAFDRWNNSYSRTQALARRRRARR
jgi:hypothetical protein